MLSMQANEMNRPASNVIEHIYAVRKNLLNNYRQWVTKEGTSTEQFPIHLTEKRMVALANSWVLENETVTDCYFRRPPLHLTIVHV